MTSASPPAAEPRVSGWALATGWGHRAADVDEHTDALRAFAEAIELAVPRVGMWVEELGPLGSALTADTRPYWREFVSGLAGDKVDENSAREFYAWEPGEPDRWKKRDYLWQVQSTVGSTNPFDPNGIWMTTYAEHPPDLWTEDPAHTANALRAVVAAVAPDWAAILPPEFETMQDRIRSDGPHIGWLTYLAGTADTLPANPAGVFRVEHVHRGRLVWLTATPSELTDEAVRSLSAQLREQVSTEPKGRPGR